MVGEGSDTIRNWRWHDGRNLGELYITPKQYMTGNVMGMLVENGPLGCPDINICNAKTFGYPVRYKVIQSQLNLGKKNQYSDAKKEIKERVRELETEGCRFICTTGGRFGLYYDFIRNVTDLMVLTNPIQMVEFASMTISADDRICIINNLEIEENIYISNEIIQNQDIKEKMIFTNDLMEHFYSIHKQELLDNHFEIGAIIWDYKECCPHRISSLGYPIYSIFEICNFLKMAVAQKPYVGLV